MLCNQRAKLMRCRQVGTHENIRRYLTASTHVKLYTAGRPWCFALGNCVHANGGIPWDMVGPFTATDFFSAHQEAWIILPS